jgi:hypothetical protein
VGTLVNTLTLPDKPYTILFLVFIYWKVLFSIIFPLYTFHSLLVQNLHPPGPAIFNQLTHKVTSFPCVHASYHFFPHGLLFYSKNGGSVSLQNTSKFISDYMLSLKTPFFSISKIAPPPTRTHAHIHVHTPACAHTHTHTCARAHSHMHAHTHKRTHTHTHTHTPSLQ